MPNVVNDVSEALEAFLDACRENEAPEGVLTEDNFDPDDFDLVRTGEVMDNIDMDDLVEHVRTHLGEYPSPAYEELQEQLSDLKEAIKPLLTLYGQMKPFLKVEP